MRPTRDAGPTDGVPQDRITTYVQQLQATLAELSRQARQTGPPLLGEMLAELTATVEELQVAEEELRVQNEHLTEAALTLEQERRRYADLFDAAPDAYLVTDLDGVIREANRAAVALLDATPRSLIGKPLGAFLPAGERRALGSRLQAAARPKPMDEWELRLKPRQGSAVDAAVTVSSVRDAQGNPVLLRWLVRNISRRRAAETERYRLMVEGVNDYAVFMMDPDNRIVSWNPGAERILGYRADEIIGQSGAIIFTPEEKAAGIPEGELRTAAATGRAEDERPHVRKDGSRFWASGVMTALRGPGGELIGYAKVLRDLTSRHEEEVRRAAELRKNRQIAEVFEGTLLRPLPPDAFAGLEVAALYEAAWEEAEIGGDYYDAFALDGERVAFLVGDVTGKGLAAASHAAEVKFAARGCLYQHHGDPAQALFHLNNYLYDSARLNGGSGEAFAALAVAVVHVATGATTVAVAGAEPPVILRAGGDVTEAAGSGGGLPVGVWRDAAYVPTDLTLTPGDALLLVTDGVTEARGGNGAFLDRDGVVALVREAGPAQALSETARVVLDGARVFAQGRLHDDACLLLVRRR